MKVRYTKHAQKKFLDLEELGVRVTKHLIRRILTRPQQKDETHDSPKTISTGMLDARHVLRIVYRKEDDTIVVITFYPAAIGRYRV